MADDKDSDKDWPVLKDHGYFLLSEDINDESAADVVRFVLEANLAGEHEQLTLVVNSPGGDVTAGFAVIDAVVGSRIPVATVGTGMIASMGLAIFIAGHPGRRTLTPNVTVLSHQWSGWLEGKEHELVAAQRHHRLLKAQMVRHFRRHTGLTPEAVRKLLLPPSDVWLTANECRRLGLCDAVRRLRPPVSHA